MTREIKTVFSKPGEPAHLDKLAGYFRRATRGSNIYVSLSRGDEEYTRLVDSTDATVHTNYSWEEYPHAARIHNKFFAFESMDYDQPWLQKNVIVVTSANINGHTKRKHESMVRFQSERLFGAFTRRWQEIENARDSGTAAPGWDEWSERYRQDDQSLKVKVYFFPYDEGDERVTGLIRNVDAGQAGTIHLLSPRFHRNQSGVANALREASEQGHLRIRVITRPRGELGTDGKEHVNFDLAGTLGTRVGYKVCKSTGDTLFHSRYLTISGTYLGKSQQIAWMGTPNLTKAAFTDAYETLLKIRDDDNEVYNACSVNFEELWNHYARVPNDEGRWPGG